jgi:hypothetical protein
MATLALAGVPSVVPPTGFVSATVKDLVPENAAALLTVIGIVFAAASPSAHFNVPVAAVKLVPATAVPLVVAYVTLTAPLDPPDRLTDKVTVPAFCATVVVAAENSRLPTLAAGASPVIVTLAVLGLPITLPPPGLDRETVKALLPENGAALLTLIGNVFGVASPSAHCKVPFVAVKSLPATAVPLLVAYATVIAPLVPFTRFAVTLAAPAFWATV